MRFYWVFVIVSFISVTSHKAFAACTRDGSIPQIDFDSLEANALLEDDMDAMLADTSVKKIPEWQLVIQEYGSSLVASLLRFKRAVARKCYYTTKRARAAICSWCRWYQKQ